MSNVVKNSNELKAHLSTNCTGCKANAHEVFAEPNLYTVGSCNKRVTVGGCFGVIYYPVRNPSKEVHEKLSRTVHAHSSIAA